MRVALALVGLAALVAAPASALAADPLASAVSAANSIAGPLMAGDADEVLRAAALTVEWRVAEAQGTVAWAQGAGAQPPEDALAVVRSAAGYARGLAGAAADGALARVGDVGRDPVGAAQSAMPPVPRVPAGPPAAPPGLAPVDGAAGPARGLAGGAADFAQRSVAALGQDATQDPGQCLHWTGSATAAYGEQWVGAGANGAWGMGWSSCRTALAEVP